MKILDFLFALIYKFVPIKEEDFAKLKGEAEADWAQTRTDEEAEKTMKSRFKKFTDKWETRLGLAIFYIFAVRMITDFMNPKEEKETEE